jgi:predicted nucleotidyltransferase
MKENLDIAAEFAEKASKAKGVLQIILFGSVASGQDTTKSDVDLAIVHNTDKFKIMEEINKLKPEKVQVTYIHIKDLSKDPVLTGALAGEGLLLYGKPIILKINKKMLSAKSIISYSLANLSQTNKVKLNRALYGSVSRSKYGKKVYVTKTSGLTNEPEIKRVMNGVLIVDRKKSFKIVNLLKRFKVDYKDMPIWSY